MTRILNTVRKMLSTAAATALLVAGLTGASGMAQAQSNSPFRTVARVNDSVVTQFEVDQRIAFLTLLRAPDTDEDAVLDGLIDDRLKMEAVRRLGADVSEEEIFLAMEEFASRANLGLEEFIAAIAQEGVEVQTFRDFVQVGVTWRNLVRTRFASQARVSDAELDRALALGTDSGNVRVLLSEIVLPLTPQTAGLTREQADAISKMTSFEDFAAAARQVSIAPSAAEDGRLAWLQLSQLPAQIAPIFLSMSPGEVTSPVPLPDGQALALFQLRALQDGRPSTTRDVDLEYMLLRLGTPGAAPAEIARLTPLVDQCDSLYGLFPGADDSRLELITTTRGEAGNAASVIDTLDPGEMAALPGGAAIVMLCKRTSILGADLSRDDLQQRLFSRKVEDFAAGFLADMRANAYIER